MSWEHELAKRIKDQGKTGGIETGYLVGHVISPKWSEADEAWTDGELIISTLEGQAMLTEGMLDRLDAGGELHDGMTVALIPGARALRGGQRFFVAEIPGHGALPGRDSPDCHPIEAITGLREELDDHDDRLDYLEDVRIPALEHDMNETGGRVPVLEGRVEALEDLESALGEDLSDLSDRVDDIVTHGGEPNVIETVKVNGTALPVSGKAVDVSVPVKTSDLTNDSGFISQETDPTVPEWAKAATKPSYTAQEVGAAEAGHTHPYLPLAGGTLTGDLALQKAVPRIVLASTEKAGTGRARSALYKNANASADNGTVLLDYVWGDATDSNARVALVLSRNVSLTKNLLRMVKYDSDGTSTTYLLYGEHNPPGIADVTGLQAALDGKAAASHSHAAGDITGTLDAARLPVVPISKGGTGETSALAALTALGGPSIANQGTLLAQNSSLNTLLTPGTYYSNAPALSATIEGAPYTDRGFRLFVAVGQNTSTTVQVANSHDIWLVRATANGGGTWSDWAAFSKFGHHHDASDITAGTLDPARLPTATGTAQGAVRLGVSGGAAAYSHSHAAGDITGTLDVARLPVVPITKGGTGETSALAALTALGGPSIGSQGTLLAQNSSINTLLTPGTYYSNAPALSATIEGAPYTDRGFRLFVAVGQNTSTTVQVANSHDIWLVRATANGGGTWSDWAAFSKFGHHHDASDITAGTLDVARLPAHTHSYLPLSGGTLTGSLTMDPTGASAPTLILLTADGAAGPGKLQLYKNANASADYGTQLADYVWGDGGATTAKNARIVIRAATSSLAGMLSLQVNEGTGGASVIYQLYGDHNRPMLDGQTVMDGSEDLNTLTAKGWYICRTNSLARQIKHTPGFDATTLVNPSLAAFNLTVGRIASDYVYQEALISTTGKRWYRYTATPTAASPTWSAWTEN